MKVLIIDPWCSDKYAVYTIGLCDGLSKFVDLTLCCSVYTTHDSDKYKKMPIFFKFSDKMKRGKARSIIRGVEYIFDYCKLLANIKKEHYDVIHVEWALMHRVDNIFLRLIRPYTKKLVYTSHNVLPHINGEKYIDELKILHKKFDVILVHGNSIKKEYIKYFPDEESKVKIQYHGVHISQKTSYVENNVDEKIKSFVESASGKIVAFVGLIFYNKGTDRVINYWVKNKKGSSDYLIVAGEISENYKELNELRDKILEYNNILFIPRYLNADEYSYVLSHSHLVTIPYRHASMSGIVYSAAAFRKPILYTDTGAISEYVGNSGGFYTENTDEDVNICLDKALKKDTEELSKMGIELHDRIYRAYNWDNIAHKLLKDVYSDS